MTDSGGDSWCDANQRSIAAALETLRECLLRHAGNPEGTDAPPAFSGPGLPDRGSGVAEETCAPPSALDLLSYRFGLSGFERDIVLLCAGIDLDSSLAGLCASAQGDPARTYPTFSLALAALPHPHWSAIMPAAPLRYWRLIEIGPGPSLTTSPLKPDERILHFLAGIQYTDERLAGYMAPWSDETGGGGLVPSHEAVAADIAAAWRDTAPGPQRPVIQLLGSDAAGKREIAGAACSDLGLGLHIVPATALPASPAELEALIRLCDREAILSSGALLLQCDDLDPSDVARSNAVTRMIEALRAPILVSTREPRRPDSSTGITLVVSRPKPVEQRALWEGAVSGSPAISPGDIEALLSQFNLSARMIRDAAARYRAELHSRRSRDEPGEKDPFRILWDACRGQVRTRLADLAQQITPVAGWDDLVLPELQKGILKTIAIQVRQRMRVCGTWGFASRTSRGLGITALFTGASGTGKTMAAEVLAHELSLDLYRIDLSQVVSKYIGETEKNLRRVFDAAETGGAILLFDEADALFGKRSEVKDSHDRYANIEISYLLQRMEEYRGLAILTTNMKDALDAAFLRRIRFAVQFPFPDEPHRAMIWERVFPRETPREGLDVRKLARLNVPGGNIHNIALSAAFLAAEDGGVVRMKHLFRAAQTEYAKMDRTLSDAEAGGWV